MTTPRACDDCGHEYTPKRPNAKYCAVCRLFRDLAFLGRRKHTCIDCGDKFAPIKSSERLCAKCDFLGSSSYTTGKCALCSHSTSPLLSTDVRVCLGCARDLDKRALLIKAVSKKRNARRSQHEAVAA